MAFDKEYWFIHYSYKVNGVLDEASMYLARRHEHFQYDRMRDWIQRLLCNSIDGEVRVVIRHYFPATEDEAKEWHTDSSHQACDYTPH